MHFFLLGKKKKPPCLEALLKLVNQAFVTHKSSGAPHQEFLVYRGFPMDDTVFNFTGKTRKLVIEVLAERPVIDIVACMQYIP